MKVGDLVKHGWIEGKHGLITRVTDKPHSYDPGKMLRAYDILWFLRGYSYVSEELSYEFEVISESR